MHGVSVRDASSKDACRAAIGPAATTKPDVIYMSYDGMLEPLGQSQVIPYLTPLSADFAIHLVSFEKESDSRRGEDVMQLRDRLRMDGITWHPLRYHKRPKVVSTVYDIVRAALVAGALARRYDVRLFHARSLLSAAMLFPAIALRNGKLIFDARGFWVDERLDGGIVKAGSLVERTLRMIERAICHRADHIVTLTWRSVASLREDPRFGHPGAPITVIPTCADLDVFTLGKAKAPGEPFVVGYVGQIGPWYRFAEMIALYRAFAAREPHARMLVVNRGQQKEVREAFRDAGISADRFEIVAAGRSEVPVHIRRMDVGVVLMMDAFSNFARGPTKLAEYLGCGVPCVGDLRVGDLHMILDGENVGVTMNDHSPEERERAVDRIMDLRCDPGLAARCVSSARLHFSLEDGVERYRAIYRSLAGEMVGCGAGTAAGQRCDTPRTTRA